VSFFMKYLKLQSRFDTTIPSSPDLSAATDNSTNGTDTGKNAIASFDPTQTTGAQQTSLGNGDNSLGSLLNGETNSYISNFANAIPSIYKTGMDMYNTPNLETTATNLQNRVTNATPNAYIAAKGYDVDATDINNGIANSTAYLTPQANAATANANTAAGLSGTYIANALLPYQAQGTLVTNQEAAQATGWNQTLQDQFNGLIDKMQSGVTLSGNEMTLAQTLAATEEKYQEAVATAEIPLTAVSNGNTLTNALTKSIINPSTLTTKTGVATY
jgi:hypothetical protein